MAGAFTYSSWQDGRSLIPFILQATGVLASFGYPNHILVYAHRDILHSPPTCDSNYFGNAEECFLKDVKSSRKTESGKQKRKRQIVISAFFWNLVGIIRRWLRRNRRWLLGSAVLRIRSCPCYRHTDNRQRRTLHRQN